MIEISFIATSIKLVKFPGLSYTGITLFCQILSLHYNDVKGSEGWRVKREGLEGVEGVEGGQQLTGNWFVMYVGITTINLIIFKVIFVFNYSCMYYDPNFSSISYSSFLFQASE